MKRPSLAPAQLALLASVGGLIMALSYIVPVLYPRFHNSSLAVRALLILPLFLLGVAILALAVNRLRNGIKNGSWPSSQITPVEALVQSWLWRGAMIVCVAMFVCSILVDREPAHQILFAGLPLWLALSTFQGPFRTPNDNLGASLTLVPPGTAPVNSDHWDQY